MLLAFRHENGFTIFTLTGIFFGSILELLQGFQTISAWFHVQDVNEAQRQFIKLRDLADKYPETYGSLPDFWSVSTKARINSEKIKGSSEPIHFIFEISVEKSRI